MQIADFIIKQRMDSVFKSSGADSDGNQSWDVSHGILVHLINGEFSVESLEAYDFKTSSIELLKFLEELESGEFDKKTELLRAKFEALPDLAEYRIKQSCLDEINQKRKGVGFSEISGLYRYRKNGDRIGYGYNNKEAWFPLVLSFAGLALAFAFTAAFAFALSSDGLEPIEKFKND